MNEQNIQSKEENEDNKIKGPVRAFFFGCILLILFCFSYAYLYIRFESILMQYLKPDGLLGDMISALGAFFAGLAFIGIATTLSLQRKEILLQRKDVQTQKGMMDKQIKANQLSAFESSFFNLLSVQREMRDSFVFLYGNDSFSGLAGMKKAYNIFITYTTENNEIVEAEDRINANQRNWDYIESKLRVSDVEKEANNGHAGYLIGENAKSQKDYLYAIDFIFKNTMLNGYIESLTRIFNYVETAEFLDDEKRDYYIGFIRCRLTNIEKCIFFYYTLALSYLKNDSNFKNRVEKHSLLSNLNHSDIIDYHDIYWDSYKYNIMKKDLEKDGIIPSIFYNTSAFNPKN